MTPTSTRRSSTFVLAVALAVCAPLVEGGAQSQAPSTARAGVRPLSLDEALRLGEAQSEAVQIARAGAQRTHGQQYQARSQYLPQVNGSVGYIRTLQSQFQGLNSAPPPDTTGPVFSAVCAPNIPANATQADRDAALAQASTCRSSGGFDFTKTGFGAANQWAFGLSASQNIFTGGRITGQVRAANAARNAAEIEVAAQRAQIALDVTNAYYTAALTDQLVRIQQSSLTQTEEILRQTRLARQVGNQSEFELLRAQVTRDNQVPVLIQRKSDREVAYLRLKQLLNIPLDDSLDLSTPIEEPNGPTIPAVAVNGRMLSSAVTDTNISDRAPVREIDLNVRALEGQLIVAKAERVPTVAINTAYQRLFFPVTAFPSLNDYRQNWTIGVTASIPIFAGGRIRGDNMIAQANLDEGRARAQQTRELAALDTRVALNTYQQAEAAWRASQGTAEQAQRAYSIDQIRYSEGLSTQTDLTQSRLLLEQAVVNRVSAARDFAIARMRLALLRDLPLQAGGAGTPGASVTGTAASAALGQGAQQFQQQQQQQRTTTTSASLVGGQTGGVQP